CFSLSLHDALPICAPRRSHAAVSGHRRGSCHLAVVLGLPLTAGTRGGSTRLFALGWQCLWSNRLGMAGRTVGLGSRTRPSDFLYAHLPYWRDLWSGYGLPGLFGHAHARALFAHGRKTVARLAVFRRG